MARVFVALAGVAGVMGTGQLWQHDLLLPESNPLFVVLNQWVIFALMLLILPLRRQGFETAWIPTDRIWLRALVGVALVACALAAYAVVTRGVASVPRVFAETYDPSRLAHIAQVLFEAIAIAILLIRLGAAVRRPWIGIVVVALLFAAGRLPSLAAGDASAADYVLLLGDVALGLIVLSAVFRTQDILWLWPVHATLDLSQFVGA